MDETSGDVRAAGAASVRALARPQRSVAARLIRRLLGVVGVAFGMWLLALLFGTASASAHTTATHHHAGSASVGARSQVEHGSVLRQLGAPTSRLVTNVVRHASHSLAQTAATGNRDNAHAGNPVSTPTITTPVSPRPRHTSKLIDSVTSVATAVTHKVLDGTTGSVSRISAGVVQPLVHRVVATITRPLHKVPGVGSIGALPTMPLPTVPLPTTPLSGSAAAAVTVLALPSLHRADTAATTVSGHIVATRFATRVAPRPSAVPESSTSDRAIRPGGRPAPALPTGPRPTGPANADQSGSTAEGSGGSTGTQLAASAPGVSTPRGIDGARRRLPATVGVVGACAPRPTFSPD